MLYCVFLARSLKPSSLPGYLNVVRLMHAEVGLENPLDNWGYKLLFKGIKRLKGEPPKQKLPITLQILLEIHSKLDLSSSFLKAFWCACVVAFFCFFRKSTLLPESVSKKTQCLCMCDVSLLGKRATIVVRHSKTIQFGQRCLKLPLMAIPQSPVCPVRAISDMLVQFPREMHSSEIPLFSYCSSSESVSCLTYASFVKTLHLYLDKCGYNAQDYSGHSFRRGGCSFAFETGLPPAMIKLRGDWRSNAYERYITITDTLHERLATALSLAAPK